MVHAFLGSIGCHGLLCRQATWSGATLTSDLVIVSKHKHDRHAAAGLTTFVLHTRSDRAATHDQRP